jgi:hypothetical protein
MTDWMGHAGYLRISYKILVGEHEGNKEPSAIQENNIDEYIK